MVFPWLHPLNIWSLRESRGDSDCSSVFKLGSTIPLKFQLTNACATNQNLVAKVYVGKVTDSIIGDFVEATSTSAADIGNTFRYTGGQYIFNLATKALGQGTWLIRIDLGDGIVNGGTLPVSGGRCSPASTVTTRKLEVSLK